jgi:hypothetical protein
LNELKDEKIEMIISEYGTGFLYGERKKVKLDDMFKETLWHPGKCD